MTRMRTLPFAVRTFLRAALLGVLIAGCSKSTTSVQPPVGDPAPPPNTPDNVVRLVAWDWNRFDASYCDLLTDDFVFVFAEGDSAGQPWSVSPWTREVESIAVQSMLHRDSGLPRLAGLSLHVDPVMISLPDPRPGKDPRYHRIVRTSVDLIADVEQGGSSIDRWIINGNALLFLVRGDSAAISQDMIERGFGPDSTRWWIQRWEDETLPIGGGLLHPTPARGFTLGGLKSRFVPVLR